MPPEDLCRVKPTASFSGVVLAGGQSRRMGRDKALLPVLWQGRVTPLWRRQYELLRSLPLHSVSVSDGPKSFYPDDLPLVPDRWLGRGPLGGIATCLACCQTDFLLIVAVDLPFLAADFLRRLIAGCGAQRGLVPVYRQRFEPLAAVYPRAAFATADQMLAQDQSTLQLFVSRLEEQALLAPYVVPPVEAGSLVNWNRPEDVSSSSGRSPVDI